MGTRDIMHYTQITIRLPHGVMTVTIILYYLTSGNNNTMRMVRENKYEEVKNK